ncbi:MAG: hypothetical protein PHU94_01315 [Bacilli bacterium]|nr:hypothetical protein [Bacilli bacterium]MDD4718866.1 hypothetical protein [Bacilli bacterium]
MEKKIKSVNKKEEERNKIRVNAQKRGEEEFKKFKTKFASKFLELVVEKKDENMEYELIAANLGITSQSLSNYCKGDRFPQMEQLILMKDFFNADYNTLLPSFPMEEKNIKNKKRGDLTSLGLSSKAIKNLEKIINYSNAWGFDEQSHIINPIIFAINKLLEDGNELLYLIGDYLLFPDLTDIKSIQADNNNISNLEDEDIYTRLYQYKVMKALEEFIINFRNTKEHRISVEHRKSRVEDIIFKKHHLNEYQNYIDEKLQKEIELIQNQEK